MLNINDAIFEVYCDLITPENQGYVEDLKTIVNELEWDLECNHQAININMGICGNVQMRIKERFNADTDLITWCKMWHLHKEIMHLVYRSWEHWTGDFFYPVGTDYHNYAYIAEYNQFDVDLWNINKHIWVDYHAFEQYEKYCALRKELLLYTNEFYAGLVEYLNYIELTSNN